MSQFVGRCCDGLKSDDLVAMYSTHRGITPAQFAALVGVDGVNKLKEITWAGVLGDPLVSFYRCLWKGIPAVNCEWSAIDHVFVLDIADSRRYKRRKLNLGIRLRKFLLRIAAAVPGLL